MKRQYQATTFERIAAILGRFTIAGFFAVVLLALLYVVGDLQQFTETTQTSLIEMLRTASSIVSMSCGMVMIFAVVGLIWQRRIRYIGRFVVTTVMLLITLSIAAGATSIAALQQGMV